MRLQEKYQRTGDRLAYMVLWGPDFPKDRRQTFSEAFKELNDYVEELLAAENRQVSIEGISKCRQATVRAKEMLDKSDEDGARFQFQFALRYLEFAQKGKEAPDPLF